MFGPLLLYSLQPQPSTLREATSETPPTTCDLVIDPAVVLIDALHRRRSSSFELVTFVGHNRLVQRLSLASCAQALAVA